VSTSEDLLLSAKAKVEVAMEDFFTLDWRAVFVPQHSLLEMVVRGTIMYLAIFAMLRTVLRRQIGGIGTTDVLVIVLIAEVAGNGIAPEAESVVEGLVLVATILFWSYVLEWLQVEVPAIERLTRDPKLQLIADGRMLRSNMRKEFVTFEELMAQLREQGLDDASTVKAAYLEADGSISVIRRQTERS
jgi:uncharacterized membrane protein YcaP (DUF421 family)